MITKNQAADVQHQLETELANNEALNGIGLMRNPNGGDDWCVIIYLTKEVPVGTIATEVNGVKVVTQVAGCAHASV